MQRETSDTARRTEVGSSVRLHNDLPAARLRSGRRASRDAGAGRPVLYGLALGGAMGVRSVCDRISDELTRAMLIAGVASIDEINTDYFFK